MACIDTCGSIGSNLKILVEDSIITEPCPVATFDENSERYEILNENVQYTDITLGGNGLTGGVDPILAHLRSGTRIVFGRILLEVGPNELAPWLPRILGNGATNPYTTDETFDNMPFDILMSRDRGTVIYRRCSVNSALLRARASIEGDEQILQLLLNVIGYEEHDAALPDPLPGLPTGKSLYWLHGDSELTFGGTEYYMDAFNLLIDNNLIPQTRNFLHITCLQSRGRTIRLRASIPYTEASHSALYINRFEGSGVLNFAGDKNLSLTPESTYDTTITMPHLYQTRRTPATRGHGEIPLPIDMVAYRDGTDEPISITNTI